MVITVRVKKKKNGDFIINSDTDQLCQNGNPDDNNGQNKNDQGNQLLIIVLGVLIGILLVIIVVVIVMFSIFINISTKSHVSLQHSNIGPDK